MKNLNICPTCKHPIVRRECTWSATKTESGWIYNSECQVNPIDPAHFQLIESHVKQYRVACPCPYCMGLVKTITYGLRPLE